MHREKNVESDLPFVERLKIREDTVAWISRDTGLHHSLLTPTERAELPPSQQIQRISNFLDNYIPKTTKVGKNANQKAITREIAGHLRRDCLKLQRNEVTHRDVARMCVLLELLWDEVNMEMTNAIWARAGRRFDTALMALRVEYVRKFLQTECPSSEVSTENRKKIFEYLVRNFFENAAPTDQDSGKHSSNFVALTEVWRLELLKYPNSEDFDGKIDRLAITQSHAGVAKCVESFIDVINIDQSWVLGVTQLEADVKEGKYKLKKEVKNPKTPRKQPASDIVYVDANEIDSSSSEEPRGNDSDFDVGRARVEEEDVDDEDNGTGRIREIDSPLSRRLARGRKKRAVYDVPIRRSSRVADAGSTQRRNQQPRRVRRKVVRYDQEDSYAPSPRYVRQQKSPAHFEGDLNGLGDEDEPHRIRIPMEPLQPRRVSPEKPRKRGRPPKKKLPPPPPEEEEEDNENQTPTNAFDLDADGNLVRPGKLQAGTRHYTTEDGEDLDELFTSGSRDDDKVAKMNAMLDGAEERFNAFMGE